MPTPRTPGAFWWLWTSSALSNLADGVLKMAVPLVALRYTDSPAQIAGLSLAMGLPWLLVALPAGALVDRWDRRQTMLVANTVRTLVLVVVLGVAMAGHASMAWLYAAALVVGVAEVFYDTTAQSILPQVVGRDALPRANGRLMAAELTANQFVGPPLGGLLAAAGVGLAFGVPAGAWALAVVALVAVRGTFRTPVDPSAPRTSLRADVAEGLHFLWTRPALRSLAFMTGLQNLASTAGGAVFVLWAVGPGSALGLSEPGYGLLGTTLAVGAVGGSLVAARVADRAGLTLTLAVSVLASAAMLAVPAVTSQIVLVGASYLAAGLGMALWNVTVVSLRQRLTPDRLLGRVNSAYRLLAWGTIPVGAAVGGLLAELAGIRVVLLASAALTAVTLVLLPAITAARIDEMEDGPRTGAAAPTDPVPAVATPGLTGRSAEDD